MRNAMASDLFLDGAFAQTLGQRFAHDRVHELSDFAALRGNFSNQRG
jgi:hypothetical protein